MLGVLDGGFSVYDTMTHFIVLFRVAVASAVEYCFGGGGGRFVVAEDFRGFSGVGVLVAFVEKVDM